MRSGVDLVQRSFSFSVVSVFWRAKQMYGVVGEEETEKRDRKEPTGGTNIRSTGFVKPLPLTVGIKQHATDLTALLNQIDRPYDSIAPIHLYTTN